MMNRAYRAARMVVIALLVAAASVVTAGCNTVKGFGEDFAAAGQGLADIAQDASK